MWFCSICGKEFRSYILTTVHRRIHWEFRPFMCTFKYCTKAFSTLSQLQSHARFHKEHRIYNCEVCHQQFFTLRHKKLHRCHRGIKLRFHHCHICTASFMHIVSLANHIHKKHVWLFKGKEKISTKWQLPLRDCKGSKKSFCSGSGSDDSKILLKITAGKSMTIVPPPSKLTTHKSGKKHWKKKSKKKCKKESMKVKSSRLILSIKKNVVSINEENKNFKRNSIYKLNRVVKSNFMLIEQRSDLKLTIKTCPEISHSPRRLDSKANVCVDDSDTILILNKHTRNSSFNSSSGSDDQDITEIGIVQNKLTEAMKERNGVVISKDKSGKFLSEQLQVAKARKKDRENIFDSFNDLGIWKVLPSPQKERSSDLFKIKLSPQKPIVRIDQAIDEANAYEGVKYLGNPPKFRDGISGDDSDILDLLPVDGKESDVGINSVNDSGIEVLSSSSYNRSNGNSVRSAVFDESSPTYLNTEDSLFSLDSPLMEGINKIEHSICNRCGGIILEQINMNNTRSPGKCRCNLSGPNSPFHPPISPLKTFSHLSDTTKAHEVRPVLSHAISDHQEHVTHVVLIPPMASRSEEIICNENSLPHDVSQINENQASEKSDSDKSNIFNILVKDTDQNDQSLKSAGLEENKKSKYLKLQGQESIVPTEKALNNEFNAHDSFEHSQTSNKNTVTDKDSLKKSPGKSLNVCALNTSLNSLISPVIVMGDENDEEMITANSQSSSEPVNRKHDNFAKLSKKRPLFKSRKSDSSISLSEDSHVNQAFTEYGIGKKRLLFKKRSFVDDTTDKCPKLPLLKRQKSTEYYNGSDILNLEDRNKSNMKMLRDCIKVPNEESLVSENVAHDKLIENNLMLENDIFCMPAGMACKSGNQIDINNSLPVPGNNKQIKQYCKGTVENCEKVNMFDDDNNTVLSSAEDNIQKLPAIINDNTNGMTSKVMSISTPLDLFQQQFLSFIAGSGKSIGKSLTHCKKKFEKKAAISNDSTENKIDLTNCKSSEKVEIANSTSIKRNNETSDSYSWLKIFSTKTNIGEEGIEKLTKKPKNELMDIAEDLSAIGMEMVDSESDDTDSLDFDDLFENVPNVAPTVNISTENQSKMYKIQSEYHLSTESHAEAQPKRRQVAKRTGVKCNKIIIHDERDSASDSDTIDLVSHNSDDPNINLFSDSDDQFGITTHHQITLSQTCSDIKIKSSQVGSTGNKHEIKSDSDMDEKCDLETRNKRIKKGRIGCCPCCIGSQRLGTKEHITNHPPKPNYKLPRNHKQFVKNTLRLLELQEKLHILFLNLFPECFDHLNKSKVGTDEFEALIEDVLYGLEEKNTNLSPVFPSVHVSNQDPFSKSDLSSCPIDISMTVPSSVSRTNGDCLNDKTLVTSSDKETDFLNPCVMYQSGSGFNYFSNTHDSLFSPNRNCATVQNSGNHSNDFVFSCAKSGSTCLSYSSTSLKFENDTLSNCPFDRKLLIGDKCCHDQRPNALDKYNLDQHSCNVFEDTCPETASTANSIPLPLAQGDHAISELDIVPSVKHDHCISLDSSICTIPSLLPTSSKTSAPYTETKMSPPTKDSVQSDLTITIDLSVAKVSLCRNPKDCLNCLQNKIIRLTRCLLPKIVFKKYIYRNIDNLEFLLDLIIEANSSGNDQIGSDGEDLVDKFNDDIWNVPNYGDTQTVFVPTVISVDVIDLNSALPETQNSLESEQVLGKYLDLNAFEQEIKLQRESLKKDLFLIDEDKSDYMYTNLDHTLTNPEHVLNSLKTFTKLASRNRKARSRDSRPRKRTADEKRTLFVQEKLNSQSSFILHSPSKFSKNIPKSTKKCSLLGDSKATFLSQFDLGDRGRESSGHSKMLTKDASVYVNKSNQCGSQTPSDVECLDGKHCMRDRRVSSVGESQNDTAAHARIDNSIDDTETIAENVDVELDTLIKPAEKNIFELMQPC